MGALAPSYWPYSDVGRTSCAVLEEERTQGRDIRLTMNGARVTKRSPTRTALAPISNVPTMPAQTRLDDIRFLGHSVKSITHNRCIF